MYILAANHHGFKHDQLSISCLSAYDKAGGPIIGCIKLSIFSQKQ